MKKKILALVLVVAMCLSSILLVACKGGEESETYTYSYSAGLPGVTGSIAGGEAKGSEEITLPANGFTAPSADYEFAGWSIGTAKEVKAAGEKVKLSADTNFVARWKYQGRLTTEANETKPLVISESTFDGVFSPFFYSSAYDGDVVGEVSVALLSTNANGVIVAGDEYPTVAKSYSVSEDGLTYTFVIKNGIKNSDGSALTADDVLFNMYVYLDPSYNGSTTMYTLPIEGLQEYRNQDPNYSVSSQKLAKIEAAPSTGYVATSDYTEAEYNAFFNTLKETVKEMAGQIITYVNASYGTDKYVQEYFNSSLTYAQVGANENLKRAFGASMWGFGDFDEGGNFIGGCTGTNYGTVETLNFTVDNYQAEILAGYTGEDGVISPDIDNEAAGSAVPFVAAEAEAIKVIKGQTEAVQSISGLRKGSTTIEGVSYETVIVKCTEKSPKTILQLTLTIAPKDYYINGYQYRTGSIVNYGCELGLNADGSKNGEFMAKLAERNTVPMGAGPYKFDTSFDTQGNTVIQFVRNEYFNESFGLGNALIKTLRMKVLELGQEMDSLKTGEVHYSDPSADVPTMNELATLSQFTPILVDNLGYGYICLNPDVYTNINERIALQSVLDIATGVANYYPNGLADVIYRAQSQVSWAYPQGTESLHPYDGTGATALEAFKAAGYTVEDGKLMKGGEQASFEFSLPSAAADHPAGEIFLNAVEVLKKIGAKAEIKTDTSLIANIKKAPVGIYALAWSSTLDPDMFQVYSYQSQAESPKSNGIIGLYANGGSADLGTISWKNETLTQKQALVKLDELIAEALKYMTEAERKPIYKDALDLLAELCIEIPTYQRKNLFVFANGVIDAETLSEVVTPYWGPLAEIWNVSFTTTY